MALVPTSWQRANASPSLSGNKIETYLFTGNGKTSKER